MKVTCTGRRVTLKPSFVELAEKKLAKLDKFFAEEAQAQVTVTVEKSGQTVELTLRSGTLTTRAEKTADRMEDALNDAVDLLVRRVIKHRKRLGAKLTAAAAEVTPQETEEPMNVVREKHFAVKPCTVEEAILQMDLLGHSFFLFRSVESGGIEVVYRRADGGVIDLCHFLFSSPFYAAPPSRGSARPAEIISASACNPAPPPGGRPSWRCPGACRRAFCPGPGPPPPSPGCP